MISEFPFDEINNLIKSNTIVFNKNNYIISSYSYNTITNNNLFKILINNNKIPYQIYSYSNIIPEWIQITLPNSYILKKFNITFSKNTFKLINFDIKGSNDEIIWNKLSDINICKKTYIGSAEIYCNISYIPYIYFRLYINTETSPLSLYNIKLYFHDLSSNLIINSVDEYSAIHFNNKYRIISQANNDLIFMNNINNNEIMRINNNGLVISSKDTQNNSLKVENGISIGDDTIKKKRYIGITDPLDGTDLTTNFSGIIVDNSNNNISFLLKKKVLSVNNDGNISNSYDSRYKLNIKDTMLDICNNNIIPITINTNGAIVSEYNIMCKNDNRNIENISNKNSSEALYNISNINIINFKYKMNTSNNNGFDLNSIYKNIPEAINNINEYIPKPFQKYNFKYIPITKIINYPQINLLYILNNLQEIYRYDLISLLNQYESNIQLIILSKINDLNILNSDILIKNLNDQNQNDIITLIEKINNSNIIIIDESIITTLFDKLNLLNYNDKIILFMLYIQFNNNDKIIFLNYLKLYEDLNLIINFLNKIDKNNIISFILIVLQLNDINLIIIQLNGLNIDTLNKEINIIINLSSINIKLLIDNINLEPTIDIIDIIENITLINNDKLNKLNDIIKILFPIEQSIFMNIYIHLNSNKTTLFINQISILDIKYLASNLLTITDYELINIINKYNSESNPNIYDIITDILNNNSLTYNTILTKINFLPQKNITSYIIIYYLINTNVYTDFVSYITSTSNSTLLSISNSILSLSQIRFTNLILTINNNSNNLDLNNIVLNIIANDTVNKINYNNMLIIIDFLSIEKKNKLSELYTFLDKDARINFVSKLSHLSNNTIDALCVQLLSLNNIDYINLIQLINKFYDSILTLLINQLSLSLKLNLFALFNQLTLFNENVSVYTDYTDIDVSNSREKLNTRIIDIDKSFILLNLYDNINLYSKSSTYTYTLRIIDLSNSDILLLINQINLLSEIDKIKLITSICKFDNTTLSILINQINNSNKIPLLKLFNNLPIYNNIINQNINIIAIISLLSDNMQKFFISKILHILKINNKIFLFNQIQLINNDNFILLINFLSTTKPEFIKNIISFLNQDNNNTYLLSLLILQPNLKQTLFVSFLSNIDNNYQITIINFFINLNLISRQIVYDQIVDNSEIETIIIGICSLSSDYFLNMINEINNTQNIIFITILTNYVNNLQLSQTTNDLLLLIQFLLISDKMIILNIYNSLNIVSQKSFIHNLSLLNNDTIQLLVDALKLLTSIEINNLIITLNNNDNSYLMIIFNKIALTNFNSLIKDLSDDNKIIILNIFNNVNLLIKMNIIKQFTNDNGIVDSDKIIQLVDNIKLIDINYLLNIINNYTNISIFSIVNQLIITVNTNNFSNLLLLLNNYTIDRQILIFDILNKLDYSSQLYFITYLSTLDNISQINIFNEFILFNKPIIDSFIFILNNSYSNNIDIIDIINTIKKSYIINDDNNTQYLLQNLLFILKDLYSIEKKYLLDNILTSNFNDQYLILNFLNKLNHIDIVNTIKISLSSDLFTVLNIIKSSSDGTHPIDIITTSFYNINDKILFKIINENVDELDFLNNCINSKVKLYLYTNNDNIIENYGICYKKINNDVYIELDNIIDLKNITHIFLWGYMVSDFKIINSNYIYNLAITSLNEINKINFIYFEILQKSNNDLYVSYNNDYINKIIYIDYINNLIILANDCKFIGNIYNILDVIDNDNNNYRKKIIIIINKGITNIYYNGIDDILYGDLLEIDIDGIVKKQDNIIRSTTVCKSLENKLKSNIICKIKCLLI